MGRVHGPLSDESKLQGERWRMRSEEPVIEDSGVVEDVYHLQLMALFHGPLRKKENGGTASALGSVLVLDHLHRSEHN